MIETCEDLAGSNAQFKRDTHFSMASTARIISIVLLCVMVVRNKRRAMKMESGARHVMLPAYFDYIALLILYCLFFGILLAFDNTLRNNPYLLCIQIGLLRFFVDGLAFFLMRYGAGVYSAKIAALQGLLWGIISGFIFFIIFTWVFRHKQLWFEVTDPNETAYILYVSYTSVIICFYAAMIFLPMQWIYRRPSMKFLSICQVIENCFWLIMASLVYYNHDVGYCVMLVGIVVLEGILQPIAIFYVLTLDSEGLHHSENNPLAGTWDLELETASAMSSAISIVERSDRLPMIHFALIELKKHLRFVAGGLSRVYFGKFKGEDVALKMLFAMELTPKVVTDFYYEVHLLHSLQHNNVVRCIGVSVMPPAVCLVLEYCPYGSLFDYLHKSRKRAITVSSRTNRTDIENDIMAENKNPIVSDDSRLSSASGIEDIGALKMRALSGGTALRMSYVSDVDDGDSRSTIVDYLRSSIGLGRLSIAKPAVEEFTLEDITRMLADAARGVAFLHSKGYMHCDIKSPNFLVAADKRIKIADLGEAREFNSSLKHGRLPCPARNWCPPECLAPSIVERTYTPESDVYGLAMVFSEIINQEVPMDDIAFALTPDEWYRRLTVDGVRPPLPDYLPMDMRAIIGRSWSTLKTQRPSSTYLSAFLDKCLSDIEMERLIQLE